MKISTKTTKILRLSRKPSQRTLQISGNTAAGREVEVLYIIVAFTKDGKQIRVITTRIGKAN